MNDYQSLVSSNKVFVKIDKIDYGSFKVDKNTMIIGCVGSRYSFKPYAYTFPVSETTPNKVWDLEYKNAARSSFVLVLFKHRFFGSDIEIGEIELKISGFETNTVTQHEFTLQSPFYGNPVKVTLSVHVSEDGTRGFKAPLSNSLIGDVVIPHQKCYSQK